MINLAYKIPSFFMLMIVSYFNTKGHYFKFYYIGGFLLRVISDIYYYFIVMYTFNSNYSIEIVTIHLYI